MGFNEDYNAYDSGIVLDVVQSDFSQVVSWEFSSAGNTGADIFDHLSRSLSCHGDACLISFHKKSESALRTLLIRGLGDNLNTKSDIEHTLYKSMYTSVENGPLHSIVGYHDDTIYFTLRTDKYGYEASSENYQTMAASTNIAIIGSNLESDCPDLLDTSYSSDYKAHRNTETNAFTQQT